MPDGLRHTVASPVLGSYFQMLPACGYLPGSSLHSEVKVMSEKYMKPSGAATPSVSTQPPSNTFISLESAGRTLASFGRRKAGVLAFEILREARRGAKPHPERDGERGQRPRTSAVHAKPPCSRTDRGCRRSAPPPST